MQKYAHLENALLLQRTYPPLTRTRTPVISSGTILKDCDLVVDFALFLGAVRFVSASRFYISLPIHTFSRKVVV